jgi:hypothetical protein
MNMKIVDSGELRVESGQLQLIVDSLGQSKKVSHKTVIAKPLLALGNLGNQISQIIYQAVIARALLARGNLGNQTRQIIYQAVIAGALLACGNLRPEPNLQFLLKAI